MTDRRTPLFPLQALRIADVRSPVACEKPRDAQLWESVTIAANCVTARNCSSASRAHSWPQARSGPQHAGHIPGHKRERLCAISCVSDHKREHLCAISCVSDHKARFLKQQQAFVFRNELHVK